jgi:hypothetical protein
MWDTSEQLGMVLEGRPGTAYGEDAFRYFLAIERARADRSNRPLRLLLVNLEAGSGQTVRIDTMVGPRIFAALRLAVRETDFIGWYREDRVAAAVLCERTTAARAEVSEGLLQRVRQLFHKRMPSGVARRLELRVVQVRPRQKERRKWRDS